jgi:uncharacterized protein YndB with AHSA1/START domain
MSQMTDLGTYLEFSGRPAVRFQRTYPHSIERVWATITRPSDLAHWFPAPEVSLEGQVGGVITFGGDPHMEPTSGTVLIWEPPTHFAFTWGGDELHLQLEELDAATCRLILIDVLDHRDAAARNAGGWYVCLEELAKAISGNPGGGPHNDSGVLPWRQIYDAHIAAGLPQGAEIPG